MSARHLLHPLRALAFAAALAAAALVGCNDNSTGCCMVCMGLCPCGDVCQPCGQVCARPKGCACSSETAASLMSEAPNVGDATVQNGNADTK